jgi:hypothetical protein
MNRQAPTPEPDGALDELGDLYLKIMDALEGSGPTRAQAALSMALVMTGEYLGFAGPDLIAWIDQTSTRAKTVAQNLPARE